MKTPHVKLIPRSPLRRGFLLIAFAGVLLAPSPVIHAQCPQICDSGNTAIGIGALSSNTTGDFNTATGYLALPENTTGVFNTATGAFALLSNTTGSSNTANGGSALQNNTIGEGNTANGGFALLSNTTGNGNTATGAGALINNTTGNGNTATGGALSSNTTGSNNTATGGSALQNNTTGSENIALGYQAGQNLSTGSHNIYIGNTGGGGGESRRIRIGTVGVQTATFMAGISGVTVPDGVGVIVGNNGKLGTVVSSARFKEAIKPMDKASEAILALEPVTFHYKHDLDPKSIPQFGLVAEDVEKVNPDLVVRDGAGKPYSVRYDAVNAMLLNEFLEEHRTVQELKATVAKQGETILQQKKDFQAIVSQQQKQIEALNADLQKVSAQVEMSRPASQTVGNSQ